VAVLIIPPFFLVKMSFSIIFLTLISLHHVFCSVTVLMRSRRNCEMWNVSLKSGSWNLRGNKVYNRSLHSLGNRQLIAKRY